MKLSSAYSLFFLCVLCVQSFPACIAQSIGRNGITPPERAWSSLDTLDDRMSRPERRADRCTTDRRSSGLVGRRRDLLPHPLVLLHLSLLPRSARRTQPAWL